MTAAKNLFQQVYDAFGFSPGGYDFDSSGRMYEPIFFVRRSAVAHLGSLADEIVAQLNAQGPQGLVSHHSEIRIAEDTA
jgi:hypothetical protein